jgi:hypothetical protein
VGPPDPNAYLYTIPLEQGALAIAEQEFLKQAKSTPGDICAAFRIKREPKLLEVGISNMLSMAHWLMKKTQGDAVLLTDEGDILLQKENGKLKPHTGHSFWTVARAAHLKKLGA